MPGPALGLVGASSGSRFAALGLALNFTAAKPGRDPSRFVMSLRL